MIDGYPLAIAFKNKLLIAFCRRAAHAEWWRSLRSHITRGKPLRACCAWVGRPGLGRH